MYASLEQAGAQHALDAEIRDLDFKINSWIGSELDKSLESRREVKQTNTTFGQITNYHTHEPEPCLIVTGSNEPVSHCQRVESVPSG
jgi:hypothetical protein